MRHQNSVFHDLLKRVPWGEFDRLVSVHGTDHRVRALRTRDQLIALLYGQLSGAVSLREIVCGLQSHSARLYHVGGREVCRASLADANTKRTASVFGGLLQIMLKQAGRRLRRDMQEATYLIDSSGLRLTGAGSDWARFSDGVHGAKVHVMYDADTECPVHVAVSAANVNDITPAEQMPVEPGATYVFDLGYYDFAWWAELHGAGCRIVTRFKKNTPLRNAVERPLAEGSGALGDDEAIVLSDRVGQLNQRISGGRSNPFNDPVREIRVKIPTGAVLRLMTNDLQAPAQQIADLYKRRWAIELFFRWVKQRLRIRHFLGRSENAVRIQIAVAMIAYLLLKLAHTAQSCVATPLQFARLVQCNLMHRKRIDQLIKPRRKPPNQNLQTELIFTAKL